MKIRNGFVSNSSSSSFCIYGTKIEANKEEIFKLIKKNPKVFNELKEWVKKNIVTELGEINGKEVMGWLDNMTDDYPDELNRIYVVKWLDDAFGELSVKNPYHDSTYFIGKGWKDIKDDETGAEFKKDVESKLVPILGDVKCETYEEAWRDG